MYKGNITHKESPSVILSIPHHHHLYLHTSDICIHLYFRHLKNYLTRPTGPGNKSIR